MRDSAASPRFGDSDRHYRRERTPPCGSSLRGSPPGNPPRFRGPVAAAPSARPGGSRNADPARDTLDERLAEYRRLFAETLVARERTDIAADADRIRWDAAVPDTDEARAVLEDFYEPAG
jgi:hypothetical protein